MNKLAHFLGPRAPAAIRPRPTFSQAMDAGIFVLLLITIGTCFYGHIGGQDSGLSLTGSYISEYMKMAPHWPWLTVSSFSLALSLSLLSAAFLLRAPRSRLIVAGCLLLAATSMANFFVAYAPVRRASQPSASQYDWWTPSWWFTSTTSSTVYEEGMADAYADVHYRATRLAVVTGVSAVLVLGLGFAGLRWGGSFGWWSLAAAVLMSALFLMGDHLTQRHGLWQRAGLVTFYGWLCLAWQRCRRSV